MFNKITIVIDESGTLPDPNDKVIIIAAVSAEMPRILAEVTKKARKGIRSRKKKEEISEIKFYQAGERTKTAYLKELSKQAIDIFVLIVDKKEQKIPDTPENFAALCYILLAECLLFYGDKITEIIFDKHFHRLIDRSKFDDILTKLLKRKLKLQHLDSSQNVEVNVADMVAGSLLWKYTGKDSKFYNLIKDKIISEKVLNWKEVKRKFFNEIKNLT